MNINYTVKNNFILNLKDYIEKSEYNNASTFSVIDTNADNEISFTGKHLKKINNYLMMIEKKIDT